MTYTVEKGLNKAKGFYSINKNGEMLKDLMNVPLTFRSRKMAQSHIYRLKKEDRRLMGK